MKNKTKPLISNKSIWKFNPANYWNYITSLYEEPSLKKKKEKEPAKDWSFRRNDRGTPVLTIRNRKPKYLTKEEVILLKGESGMSSQELHLFLKKKEVAVRLSMVERLKKKIKEKK